MHVHAVLDVPDLDEHEVRHHRLEGDVFAVRGIVELELGRRDVEVDGREARERVVVELRDGDQRDVAQLQLAGKLDDGRRLARQRDDDEKVILRQGLEYGVELLAGRDVVEEDVVVEEQALELLQDVGLHVA